MQLFFRAAEGDLQAVSGLIDSGVCVNAVDYCSRSALHIASESGHTTTVQALMDATWFQFRVSRELLVTKYFGTSVESKVRIPYNWYKYAVVD